MAQYEAKCVKWSDFLQYKKLAQANDCFFLKFSNLHILSTVLAFFFLTESLFKVLGIVYCILCIQYWVSILYIAWPKRGILFKRNW